jgi:large subunit ribosomal protein L16
MAAVDLAIKRTLKKEGEILWRTYPHIPASAKPAEVRMGKGKGSNSFWYSRIRPGAILFELITPNNSLGLIALKTACSKLSFKTNKIAV